ncbi:MAG: hypothetical protein ACOCXQ_04505 [Patescibacteria group bacterium]
MSLVLAPEYVIAALEDARCSICPEYRWHYQPKTDMQRIFLDEYRTQNLNALGKDSTHDMLVAGGINGRQITHKLRKRLLSQHGRRYKTPSCTIKTDEGIGLAVVVRKRFQWLTLPFTHDDSGNRYTINRKPAMLLLSSAIPIRLYRTGSSRTEIISIPLYGGANLFLSPYGGEINHSAVFNHVLYLTNLITHMKVQRCGGILLPMVSIKKDYQRIEWIHGLGMSNEWTRNVVEGTVQEVKLAIGPNATYSTLQQDGHISFVYQLSSPFIGWMVHSSQEHRPSIIFHAPLETWRNPGKMLATQ